MAGQNGELYQRMLGNLAEYVTICDESGFAGFGHPEHHLQVEGLEVIITNPFLQNGAEG